MRLLLALLTLSAALLTGCRSSGARSSGAELAACGPSAMGYTAARPMGDDFVVAADPSAFMATDLELARRDLQQADALARQGQEEAVDAYYAAALQAANGLDDVALAGPESPVLEVYQRALNGLIVTGQRHGRLDPRRQLTVRRGGATLIVPINYYGFAWQPRDFMQLDRADQFSTKEIKERFVNPGVGLPLVVTRISPREEPFYRPRHPFGATIVLRPTSCAAASPDSCGSSPTGSESVLEFYNPHLFRAVQWQGTTLPLAGDLTAPLAATVQETPRQYLRGFTAPMDVKQQPKLVMLEPCQPGKIPVIFIHGIYSDAITWSDTVNELRAHADIYQRYQFWAFRYPTGGAMLESSAALRAKLVLAQQQCMELGAGCAMSNAVLIGHSMGGLMAKSQATYSYDILWREIAVLPFDHLRASPQVRERLAHNFFFEPSPAVSRIVFIGTPHHGSSMARRVVGRISSSLVSFGADKTEYRQLMEANDDVFKPYVKRSRPTSVDFLEPTSPYLHAFWQMPIAPQVRLHSIIGTGGISLSEPTDGVVTVESARHPNVQSEVYVPAVHEKLHRHPDSIQELLRILRLHAAEVSTENLAKRSHRPPRVPVAATAQSPWAHPARMDR